MFRATLLSSLLFAVPVAAQDVVDLREAKRLLFNAKGSEILIQDRDFLTDLDRATLEQMPKLAELKYYGALAAPPDTGLQSEATTGAFNYHDRASARRAAVEGCDAKRAGGATCVIVAEILPRRYRDGRALTLNQDATAALRGRDFQRAGPNGVLAASPSTGAWGLGATPEAAVAACGADDCEAAVAN
ncbi:MAG: 5-aminolevulic acid synthase [Pseudomonadota bacterium]